MPDLSPQKQEGREEGYAVMSSTEARQKLSVMEEKYLSNLTIKIKTGTQ